MIHRILHGLICTQGSRTAVEMEQNENEGDPQTKIEGVDVLQTTLEGIEAAEQGSTQVTKEVDDDKEKSPLIEAMSKSDLPENRQEAQLQNDGEG